MGLDRLEVNDAAPGLANENPIDFLRFGADDNHFSGIDYLFQVC